MKKKSESEVVKRINKVMADRNCKSQAAFGKEFKFQPTTLNAWIKGASVPSPDAYMKLAMVARDVNDSMFFWEQAGLTRDAIRNAAAMIESLSESHGDMIPIPRIRETGEPAGGPISLSSELVPGCSKPKALCVDEHSIGEGMAPFGLYVLDTSVLGTADIRALRNEMIMIRFDPSQPQMFPTGLYAGMMRVHRGTIKNQIQVRARLMLWPPPSSLEDDLRQYDFLLGVYRDPEAMSGLNPKDLGAHERRKDEIWEHVGAKFPLAEGINILGTIRAFFPSHREDDSLGF